MDRREFLGALVAGAGAAALGPLVRRGGGPLFEISLAGWSLHRRHFEEHALDALDFPKVARREFDLGAIELVNTMLPSPHSTFCNELLARARDHGVKILLIMCDHEGDLSSSDPAARRQAVRNHHKWVDVAAVLGCHSIRVNAGGRPGDGDDEQRCAESLAALAGYSAEQNVHVLVENHGGLSSDPASLLRVLESAGTPWVGTLPDFGNFPPGADRYAAVRAMMPFAKAVSAKCYDFDEAGQETRIDFGRMLRIVLDAGYRGHVGIEYEGTRLGEHEGILAARELLLDLRRALGPEYS